MKTAQEIAKETEICLNTVKLKCFEYIGGRIEAAKQKGQSFVWISEGELNYQDSNDILKKMRELGYLTCYQNPSKGCCGKIGICWSESGEFNEQKLFVGFFNSLPYLIFFMIGVALLLGVIASGK